MLKQLLCGAVSVISVTLLSRYNTVHMSDTVYSMVSATHILLVEEVVGRLMHTISDRLDGLICGI